MDVQCNFEIGAISDMIACTTVNRNIGDGWGGLPNTLEVRVDVALLPSTTKLDDANDAAAGLCSIGPVVRRAQVRNGPVWDGGVTLDWFHIRAREVVAVADQVTLGGGLGGGGGGGGRRSKRLEDEEGKEGEKDGHCCCSWPSCCLVTDRRLEWKLEVKNIIRTVIIRRNKNNIAIMT